MVPAFPDFYGTPLQGLQDARLYLSIAPLDRRRDRRRGDDRLAPDASAKQITLDRRGSSSGHSPDLFLSQLSGLRRSRSRIPLESQNGPGPEVRGRLSRRYVRLSVFT